MTYQASASSFRLGYSITWASVATSIYINKSLRINILLNTCLKGLLGFFGIRLVKWFLNSESPYLKIGVVGTQMIFKFFFKKKRNRQLRISAMWQHFYFDKKTWDLRMIHNFYFAKKVSPYVYLTSGTVWKKKFRSIFFILSKRNFKIGWKLHKRLDAETHLYSQDRENRLSKIRRNPFKSVRFVANFPILFQFYQFSFILFQKIKTVFDYSELKVKSIKTISEYFFSCFAFISIYIYLKKYRDLLFPIGSHIYSSFDRFINRSMRGRRKKGYPMALLQNFVTRKLRRKTKKNYLEVKKKIPYFPVSMKRRFFHRKLKKKLRRRKFRIKNPLKDWDKTFKSGFFKKDELKKIIKKQIIGFMMKQFNLRLILKSQHYRSLTKQEKIQFLKKIKYIRLAIKCRERIRVFNKIIKNFIFQSNKNKLRSFKMNLYSFTNHPNLMQNLKKLIKSILDPHILIKFLPLFQLKRYVAFKYFQKFTKNKPQFFYFLQKQSVNTSKLFLNTKLKFNAFKIKLFKKKIEILRLKEFCNLDLLKKNKHLLAIGKSKLDKPKSEKIPVFKKNFRFFFFQKLFYFFLLKENLKELVKLCLNSFKVRWFSLDFFYFYAISKKNINFYKKFKSFYKNKFKHVQLEKVDKQKNLKAFIYFKLKSRIYFFKSLFIRVNFKSYARKLSTFFKDSKQQKSKFFFVEDKLELDNLSLFKDYKKKISVLVIRIFKKSVLESFFEIYRLRMKFINYSKNLSRTSSIMHIFKKIGMVAEIKQLFQFILKILLIFNSQFIQNCALFQNFYKLIILFKSAIYLKKKSILFIFKKVKLNFIKNYLRKLRNKLGFAKKDLLSLKKKRKFLYTYLNLKELKKLSFKNILKSSEDVFFKKAVVTLKKKTINFLFRKLNFFKKNPIKALIYFKLIYFSKKKLLKKKLLKKKLLKKKLLKKKLLKKKLLKKKLLKKKLLKFFFAKKNRIKNLIIIFEHFFKQAQTVSLKEVKMHLIFKKMYRTFITKEFLKERRIKHLLKLPAYNRFKTRAWIPKYYRWQRPWWNIFGNRSNNNNHWRKNYWKNNRWNRKILPENYIKFWLKRYWYAAAFKTYFIRNDKLNFFLRKNNQKFTKNNTNFSISKSQIVLKPLLESLIFNNWYKKFGGQLSFATRNLQKFPMFKVNKQPLFSKKFTKNKKIVEILNNSWKKKIFKIYDTLLNKQELIAYKFYNPQFKIRLKSIKFFNAVAKRQLKFVSKHGRPDFSIKLRKPWKPSFRNLKRFARKRVRRYYKFFKSIITYKKIRSHRPILDFKSLTRRRLHKTSSLYKSRSLSFWFKKNCIKVFNNLQSKNTVFFLANRLFLWKVKRSLFERRALFQKIRPFEHLRKRFGYTLSVDRGDFFEKYVHRTKPTFGSRRYRWPFADPLKPSFVKNIFNVFIYYHKLIIRRKRRKKLKKKLYKGKWVYIKQKIETLRSFAGNLRFFFRFTKLLYNKFYNDYTEKLKENYELLRFSLENCFLSNLLIKNESFQININFSKIIEIKVKILIKLVNIMKIFFKKIWFTAKSDISLTFKIFRNFVKNFNKQELFYNSEHLELELVKTPAVVKKSPFDYWNIFFHEEDDATSEDEFFRLVLKYLLLKYNDSDDSDLNFEQKLEAYLNFKFFMFKNFLLNLSVKNLNFKYKLRNRMPSIVFIISCLKILIFKNFNVMKLYYNRPYGKCTLAKKNKHRIKKKKASLWLTAELEKILNLGVKIYFINAHEAVGKLVLDKNLFYLEMIKNLKTYVLRRSWRQKILNADILWTFLISIIYFSSSYLAEMISEQIVRRKYHWPLIYLIKHCLCKMLKPIWKNRSNFIQGARVSINGKINGKDRGIKHVIYYSVRKNQKPPILPMHVKIDYSLMQADSWYGSFGIQVWLSRL